MTANCPGCQTSAPLDFDFSMAFQPIMDAESGQVWGYEALVRGRNGEGAGAILSRVTPEQRYRFDQACRVKALELAARLFPRDMSCKLSINFLPNAVYEPAACLRATLAAARKTGFPRSSIMFEFTENEEVVDTGHLQRIITEYRRQGFITALDDFGAGYAGLSLLANFQPDLIKIDMDLIRGIAESRVRQSIVAAIAHLGRELGITLLAEGIESEAELLTLKAAGIRLFQGYYFARPTFEALPPIDLSGMAGTLERVARTA
ncbi:EAL domain-containing protein [Mangrovibrevibacter kandeliae]|uniref:EAL domain-containing protein n=1 Tax=Mangrovibrevibacter kandeliae TaxID=2968473 RepID=UPI0021198D0A|nr:EAL domain-containing protein [Aurantimonas sp. CSK15Z-1]MCQ8783331.1 EAL domain-containing protein [Aurantimonas sp. CSK15Z-1]